MRWILLAAMLAAGAAQAQEAAPAHTHRTLAERFDEANTTHDGHLTAEQARAKMPAVSRDFTAIDTGNRGYVTVGEIQAYNRQKRAASRAAKKAAALQQ